MKLDRFPYFEEYPTLEGVDYRTAINLLLNKERLDRLADPNLDRAIEIWRDTSDSLPWSYEILEAYLNTPPCNKYLGFVQKQVLLDLFNTSLDKQLDNEYRFLIRQLFYTLSGNS